MENYSRSAIARTHKRHHHHRRRNSYRRTGALLVDLVLLLVTNKSISSFAQQQQQSIYPPCCICQDNCVSSITIPDAVIALPEGIGIPTASCADIQQAAQIDRLFPEAYCAILWTQVGATLQRDCGCSNWIAAPEQPHLAFAEAAAEEVLLPTMAPTPIVFADAEGNAEIPAYMEETALSPPTSTPEQSYEQTVAEETLSPPTSIPEQSYEQTVAEETATTTNNNPVCSVCSDNGASTVTAPDAMIIPTAAPQLVMNPIPFPTPTNPPVEVVTPAPVPVYILESIPVPEPSLTPVALPVSVVVPAVLTTVAVPAPVSAVAPVPEETELSPPTSIPENPYEQAVAQETADTNNNPVCWVCFDNGISTVTRPDALIDLPPETWSLTGGQTQASCAQMQTVAEGLRLVPAELCPLLDRNDLRLACGCANAIPTSAPQLAMDPIPFPTNPPAEVVVPAPVPVYIPEPIPVPVPPPTPVALPVPVVVPAVPTTVAVPAPVSAVVPVPVQPAPEPISQPLPVPTIPVPVPTVGNVPAPVPVSDPTNRVSAPAPATPPTASVPVLVSVPSAPVSVPTSISLPSASVSAPVPISVPTVPVLASVPSAPILPTPMSLPSATVSAPAPISVPTVPVAALPTVPVATSPGFTEDVLGTISPAGAVVPQPPAPTITLQPVKITAFPTRDDGTVGFTASKQQGSPCYLCFDDGVSTITNPDAIAPQLESPLFPKGLRCEEIRILAEDDKLLSPAYCSVVDNAELRRVCGCENVLVPPSPTPARTKPSVPLPPGTTYPPTTEPVDATSVAAPRGSTTTTTGMILWCAATIASLGGTSLY